jgi:hypothetical protein
MDGKSHLSAFFAIIVCFMLVSCSGITQVNPSVITTDAPATTGGSATLQPTPVPTPSTSTLSPTQAPTPSPTAAPTPTPTPDPWAGIFAQSGAYVTVPDQDKGPWTYKDQNLNVHIEKRKLGSRVYFRAEIYTRGPLPFGGFANNDTSGHKRALPYMIARQNKAIFGITGDFVIIGDNPKGVMIRQGKVYHDKKQAPTLAVMPDGNLQVYDRGKITAKQLLGMGVKESFAFGPILVRDGKINKEVYTHRLKTHNWRAAIGQIEKGHYIVIVNPIGISLAELAQLFVDNKCTLAYNMDGGHSTSIVFMGEQLYKQSPGEDNGEQRSLSDLLLIGTSPAVPAPDAPVYCNGLGYNVKARPKPTDGPIQ